MKTSFTVRDLPASERPRERLVKLGAEALSVQEILALILGSGTRGEPVMSLAHKLLAEFGDLKGISLASLDELQALGGMGLARAARLKASCEVARRLEETPLQEARASIKMPDDAVGLVKPHLRDKKKEHFLVLLLDVRNRPIGAPREVSVGSLDMSLAFPREVFKEAVSACAASVILVHNHPSGDPEPSEDDVKLTRRLAEAGELMGITVTDHIIVCDNRYLSLKGRNLF